MAQMGTVKMPRTREGCLPRRFCSGISTVVRVESTTEVNPSAIHGGLEVLCTACAINGPRHNLLGTQGLSFGPQGRTVLASGPISLLRNCLTPVLVLLLGGPQRGISIPLFAHSSFWRILSQSFSLSNISIPHLPITQYLHTSVALSSFIHL